MNSAIHKVRSSRSSRNKPLDTPLSEGRTVGLAQHSLSPEVTIRSECMREPCRHGNPSRTALYYMPYTHSLPGALAWAAAAGILYRLITGSVRGGVLVAGAVFSHWPLDFLVHRPDLALYDDAAKVGLGLWDNPYITLALEGALLLGAMGLYMARSRPLTSRGRFSMPAFGLAILLMQTGMLFSPPPPSDHAMAATALIAYALLAATIAWLERGGAFEERTQGDV